MLAAAICSILTTQAPVYDLAIVNAKIWSDGRTGFAEFAGIKDGKFVYVGSTPAKVSAKVMMSMGGKVVIPGLIDSHIHMLGGGQSLSLLDLRPSTSKENFVSRVQDWAKALGPKDWIIGQGWSVESWQVQESPRKEWLDLVTGGRPAFLERMDGHSCVVNSAALKLAGITKDGPKDPPGGVIDRDANGEPTGVLRENAASLVSRLLPQPTPAQSLANLKLAIRHANANGITSVSDIPSLSDLPIYAKLSKEPKQSMRFLLYPTPGSWITAIPVANGFNGMPNWVRVNGLKAYMDGSLGSHTAYMHGPFSENPPDKKDWRGLPMPAALDGTYAKYFAAAGKSKLQPIVHAIGDEANHLLLDLLQANVPNLKTARARSEHAQHLLPADIPRFAQLGVIASMQPYHKADDGRYAEKHIGAERCHSSYAYKRLLDSGVVLAFGSDWPVVDLNPFLGMEAAVTGRIMTGSIWEPQNNITVAEALRSYTTAGAYAAFAESQIGKIEVGYKADFVVLNQSPFGASPDWKAIKPTSVFVEGRKVYP
jgi:predicted amidohydrolase YtcJ